MKTKKLTLVPIHQLSQFDNGNSTHTATFNAKHGMMTFSADYIRDKGMNNQFVRFFADSKNKVIAWCKVMGNDLLTTHKGRVRQIKTYKTNKTPIVTLPKQAVLDFFQMNNSVTLEKRCPIQSYKDPIFGQVDYIELEIRKTKAPTITV